MRKVDPQWDLYMSLEHFEDCIKDGLFTDDDGFAEYLIDAYCTDMMIAPSQFDINNVPASVTGIIWYNK